MRLGVYGGTFDPPHLAHLIAAERVFETLALDELLIVPCGQPALKGAAAADAEHRLAMTRLAFADRPGFTVSDLEALRPGVSYTVETLETLVAGRPQADWWLVIGGDALTDFARWYRPGRIVELARLAAVDRPGSQLDRVLANLAPELASRVDRVPMPQLEIASRQLRAAVAEGRSIRYQVTDPVRAYVSKHRLYTTA